MRSAGWLRSADGTLADVPRKVSANIRGLVSGRLALRPSRRLLRRLLRLLLAGDRHQHLLLPGGSLPWLLRRLLFSRAGGADTLAQRVHQVHHVLAARTLFRGDWFSGALLVDEID